MIEKRRIKIFDDAAVNAYLPHEYFSRHCTVCICVMLIARESACLVCVGILYKDTNARARADAYIGTSLEQERLFFLALSSEGHAKLSERRENIFRFIPRGIFPKVYFQKVAINFT